MIWKKKSINLKLNKFIKTFDILIKSVIILFEVERKAESKNPQVLTTKKNVKCLIVKKSKFIKEQEAIS